MRKASLMGLSARRVCALRHQTGRSTQPWNGPGQGGMCQVLWHPLPSLIQLITLETPMRDANFLRNDSKRGRNMSALSNFMPR